MNYTLTLLSVTFAATLIGGTAFADSWTYQGPNGGSVGKSWSWTGTTASRSFDAYGPQGGSASVQGSCSEGSGCSRSWSRTLRDGTTASGTASAQRGVGVSRSGTGFRGRSW